MNAHGSIAWIDRAGLHATVKNAERTTVVRAKRGRVLSVVLVRVVFYWMMSEMEFENERG